MSLVSIYAATMWTIHDIAIQKTFREYSYVTLLIWKLIH